MNQTTLRKRKYRRGGTRGWRQGRFSFFLVEVEVEREREREKKKKSLARRPLFTRSLFTFFLSPPFFLFKKKPSCLLAPSPSAATRPRARPPPRRRLPSLPVPPSPRSPSGMVSVCELARGQKRRRIKCSFRLFVARRRRRKREEERVEKKKKKASPFFQRPAFPLPVPLASSLHCRAALRQPLRDAHRWHTDHRGLDVSKPGAQKRNCFFFFFFFSV